MSEQPYANSTRVLKGPRIDKKYQCGAKTRSGKPCTQPAMANGRCKMHGGAIPGGVNSPNLKHGRYSKYLPRHLADSYDASMADPNQLELYNEIALVDARLSELLRKIGAGGGSESWERLGQILGPLGNAVNKGLQNQVQRYTRELLEIWETASEDAAIWAEIYSAVDTRRRLADSEKKRLMDMNLMIESSRAYLLISAVQDIILRNISDQSIRLTIAHELGAILNPDFNKRSEPAQIESRD